jgi:hypothetical protein
MAHERLKWEKYLSSPRVRRAYEAAEDDTEAVYVTFPHWMDAQTKSEQAHRLDSYHPVSAGDDRRSQCGSVHGGWLELDE